MAIAQEISTFSVIPLRSSASTFFSDAETFLSEFDGTPLELNIWAAQVNATLTEFSQYETNTETNKDNALAAANYLGEWSDQTGSATVPSSVTHDSSYWVLNTNLADITASEPGVSSDWDEFKVGRARGSTSTSTGSNVTLTSSSAPEQIITPSADILVIMPDATTVQEGFNFIVSNNGLSHELTIADSASTTVKAIGVNEVGLVVCTDNSDAAGTWAVYEYTFRDNYGIQHYSGTAEIFHSGATSWQKVVALSSTKALVVFADGADSEKGKACVLTISGATVSAGSATAFETGHTDAIDAVKISETKVLVCYSDMGDSGYGKAVVLTISGTSISVGTPVTFESASTTYIKVAYFLVAGKALVAYKDEGNSNKGTGCVLTVSGTTVTADTPVVFDASACNITGIVNLDYLSTAIVVYSDVTAGYYGKACHLAIGASPSITAQTPVTFLSDVVYYTDIDRVSSTSAIISYQDNSDSSYGKVRMLSVSGVTITAGTAETFESSTTTWSKIKALSTSKALIVYRDEGNSNYGTACNIKFSGSDIVTAETPRVFASADCEYVTMDELESDKVVIAYMDNDQTDYGVARTLE